MSNPFANWWRGRQFSAALKQGNTRLAERLLQESQNSGARLSWLEKLFRDKLQSAQSIHQYKTEAATLSRQLRQASQRIENLEQKIEFYQPGNLILKPETEFINFILNTFNLIDHDEHKLQCTGIDASVFDEFEVSIVEYLKQEFAKKSTAQLKAALKDAHEDIDRLKNGQDPAYSLELTPHVYFMKYFLGNVYGAYLAWFLIYKSGLLPTKLNILDIAAGPGTIAYGLALLLQSSSSFFPMPAMHISYYSLEQQASFQYRGLQLWRRYIEPQQTATNAYFRFDTYNFLDYYDQPKKIPENFFDFIVISHCFFSDPDQRMKSYKIYAEVFSNCLTNKGYVLLIIQGRKLFKAYNVRPNEDGNQEATVVRRFVEELGLTIEWYKYITSTGKRTPTPSNEFAKFAEQNLPPQNYMGVLMQQYLGIQYKSNYVLDDYVILAKK